MLAVHPQHYVCSMPDCPCKVSHECCRCPQSPILPWYSWHLPIRKLLTQICVQENQGVWGWELDEADMVALSSIQPQIKYFENSEPFDPAGPYRNYEELWDEARP